MGLRRRNVICQQVENVGMAWGPMVNVPQRQLVVATRPTISNGEHASNDPMFLPARTRRFVTFYTLVSRREGINEEKKEQQEKKNLYYDRGGLADNGEPSMGMGEKRSSGFCVWAAFYS